MEYSNAGVKGKMKLKQTNSCKFINKIPVPVRIYGFNNFHGVH